VTVRNRFHDGAQVYVDMSAGQTHGSHWGYDGAGAIAEDPDPAVADRRLQVRAQSPNRGTATVTTESDPAVQTAAPRHLIEVRPTGTQQDTIRIPATPLALQAAIYLPTDLAERDLTVWRERCIAHCLHMGYDILVVVTGGAEAYAQLQDDLRHGAVQVVVVGRREHLPPQRTPRIEEAGVEPPTNLAPPQNQLRPRRIRRARLHWDERA
jgi:hypothetical protein